MMRPGFRSLLRIAEHIEVEALRKQLIKNFAEFERHLLPKLTEFRIPRRTIVVYEVPEPDGAIRSRLREQTYSVGCAPDERVGRELLALYDLFEETLKQYALSTCELEHVRRHTRAT